MSREGAASALTVIIWLLVAATLAIGGWKLTHMNHHSDDQNLLIEKSKSN